MQETVDEIDEEAETVDETTAETEDEPKKRKGFFGRLFK